MSRDFKRLIAGKFFSDAGGFLDWVAMSLYVYALRGSARDVGVFMALKTLGAFLGGLYAGSLDGIDRKRLMIASDLIRGAALVALAVSPLQRSFGALCAVGALLGFFGSVFTAALQAGIPSFVGEAERPAANALCNTASCAAMVAGSLSAGVLMKVVGIRPIWLFDAATFFISAVNLASLPLRANRAAAPKGGALPSFGALKEVFLHLRALPAVCFILAIRLADTLGSAAHNVAFPVFSTQLLRDNPSLAFGGIVSCWALGKVVGGRVTASLETRSGLAAPAALDTAFGAATALMSLSFVTLFYLKQPAAAAAAAILAGAADGISELCFLSRLQRMPEAIRGGVFGAAGAVQSIGMALGMVLCSPLFDRMAAAHVVTALHGVPLVLAAVFTALSLRIGIKIDHYSVSVEQEVISNVRT